MSRPLERKDWVNAKRRYLYSDISYEKLAKEIGISKAGLLNGFKREFPQTDWKARKAEQKKIRESEKLAKIKESGDIERIKINNAVDVTDSKHLELINFLLDKALVECEEGTLKAKSIKDIIELMNMHRTISNKRTSKDRVIIIKPEQPEDVDPLPEIIEGEFEEV